MKKLILFLLMFGTIFTVSSQQLSSPPYTQRALELLGLDESEIDQILEIQETSASDIRRLNAELEIRKAELARLLLDEEPNMRLVERNLRSTADVEVEIRMTEIRREVEIRKIVGTDRWARIVQALRQRREELARETGEIANEQIRALQRTITEKQREIAELIRSGRSALTDEEVRRQFLELQRQYQELQRIIRERL